MARFTVGSVTGYQGVDGKTAGHAIEVTVWYVHDSAFNYAMVREFHGPNGERNARAYAASLERRHQLPPHGVYRYSHYGCRCEECKQAKAARAQAYYRRKVAA